MKNSDALEAHIQENLNEGEAVLWSGRPVGITLLESPHGSPIIIRWIVCLVFAVVALWYGLIYVPGNENITTNGIVIMLIIIALAIFVAIRPLMEVSKLSRKCFYYITDRRALILIKGNIDIVKGKLLADAPEITTDKLSEGRGNIYIGKKAANSDKRARFSTLLPPQPEEDIDKPFVFYSVADPDDVLKYFPAQNSND